MARVQLCVLEVERTWRLLLNGEGLGRFALRSSALDCAEEIARHSREDGEKVELLAQDPWGEIVVLEHAPWP